MSIPFDILVERLYREVLQQHKRREWVLEPAISCMCGWEMSLGFNDFQQHLAEVITAWIDIHFSVRGKYDT